MFGSPYLKGWLNLEEKRISVSVKSSGIVRLLLPGLRGKCPNCFILATDPIKSFENKQGRSTISYQAVIECG